MIAIQISTKNAQSFISNLSKNMEIGGEEISKECAKMAAWEYANSASQAGITPWRGYFYGALSRQMDRPVRLGKFTYGVSIASMNRRTSKGKINYFLALDRMKTHRVTLYKNRIITKWARSKGIKSGGITVSKHPFIERAESRIFKKIPKIAEKIVNQKIRASKR